MIFALEIVVQHSLSFRERPTFVGKFSEISIPQAVEYQVGEVGDAALR